MTLYTLTFAVNIDQPLCYLKVLLMKVIESPLKQQFDGVKSIKARFTSIRFLGTFCSAFCGFKLVFLHAGFMHFAGCFFP